MVEKKISRQQAWQDKRFKEGKCVTCGQPRKRSRYKRHCTGCGEKASKRARKRAGCGKWRPGGPGRPPHRSAIAKDAAVTRAANAAT